MPDSNMLDLLDSNCGVESNTKNYYLYQNSQLIKKTESLEYAFFWILNNFINTPNNNLQINITNSYFDDYAFETIKILNNKLVKFNNLIDKTDNKNETDIITTYSPYDLDYFNKLELSLLYQKIYNKKTKIQTPSHVSAPLPASLPASLPAQTQAQNIILENNIKSDEIKKMISVLEKEKSDVEKNIKKREDEWMDNDCNIKFEKMQIRKREERLKEKYNIFLNDINIYNKLGSETNFSEDFIPHLFCAKYYILKYLFANKYFDNEDIKNPSDELFTLYRFLYVYLNKSNDNNDEDTKNTIDDDLERKKKNDKHHEDNDFNDMDSVYNYIYNDIFTDFIDFLPDDKEIITDKQIMKNINIKGDNDMFKENTGYESETGTELETESETESESESESETESINSEYIETELINEFKKSIDKYIILKKENENPSSDFVNKYNIIKYLFKNGHLEPTDIDESIDDCVYLYELLNDYINKKDIPAEIIKAFDEDIKEFTNFINFINQ